VKAEEAVGGGGGVCPKVVVRENVSQQPGREKREMPEWPCEAAPSTVSSMFV